MLSPTRMPPPRSPLALFTNGPDDGARTPTPDFNPFKLSPEFARLGKGPRNRYNHPIPRSPVFHQHTSLYGYNAEQETDEPPSTALTLVQSTGSVPPENAETYKDLLGSYTLSYPPYTHIDNCGNEHTPKMFTQRSTALSPVSINKHIEITPRLQSSQDLPMILTRFYFRVIPELAVEPSSSMLLITPGSRFIDVRFSRSVPTTLHWGSSGTYYRTPTHGLRGHSIDSSTIRPESHYHNLRTQANGDVHQSGERGTDGRSYEEVWRPCNMFPRVVVALTLRAATGKGKSSATGCVIRVGGWCQGIVKIGNDTTVERWMRQPDARWKRIARVGKEMVPCGIACMDRDESPNAAGYQGARYWKEAIGAGFVVEKTVTVSDTIKIGRFVWEVIERETWEN